ncbi:MAG TPA: acyl-CoA dehydrogenase family protein [Dehalococcoidia bacterium]|nr:acyl-CoA dehydrogenase family protein [Dehalococcoidia bacterium]
MEFRFTEAEERWREEIRSFLAAELPRESRIGADWTQSQEAWDRSLEFVRRVAERGWLTLAWPKQYGGQERSHMEQLIFNEEMAYHRAPMARAGIGTGLVAPTLMIHGNDAQRGRHLPAIARAEEMWCQGFSEPNAGSDLAGLETRAVHDGDDFVVNGQKIWTSAAHHCDWCLLGVRTDSEAPKHRGISLLMVDMKSPGISVQPIVDMRDSHYFNQVFFENVRVPRENLIGEENRGWYAMTTTLDFERSGIGMTAGMRRTLEDWLAFIREHGHRHIDTAVWEAVRRRIADIVIEIEVGRTISYRVVSLQARGLVPNYEASMAKLYGSELSQRLAALGMHLLGLYGELRPGSEHALMGGRVLPQFLESAANTIRGGTSEVQRNIIATRGLGLPR